jgi:ABC-type branched-subunit amino acid transport system substrate-binding protein
LNAAGCHQGASGMRPRAFVVTGWSARAAGLRGWAGRWLRLAVLSCLAAGGGVGTTTASAAPASQGARPLDARERGGEQIFRQATSPSGARISARIGVSSTEISGPSMACGNCHGEDGRGRSEGGVSAPSILWSELTKSYGHVHEDGRRHGPFDVESLRRAVMGGVDPAGNRLDPAMPRFAMSASDFASLVAFLKRLEDQRDPGIAAQALRVATLLPTGAQLGPLGDGVQALLSGYFDKINAQGGIHGRKLELVVQRVPGEIAEARQALHELFTKTAVFAVLAPFSVGLEADLAREAAAARVPVLGPLTLYPEDVRASNTYVFHLLPGVAELAQVLGQHGRQRLGLAERTLSLLHPDTEGGRAAADTARAQLRKLGYQHIEALPFLPGLTTPAALARQIAARPVAGVLLLGPGIDVAAVVGEAERAGSQPQWLVPGLLASRGLLELPGSVRERITLAYPSAPNDVHPAVRAEIETLAGSRGHPTMQSTAYGAALLMVDALKRTGRELSRSKFIAALEQVQGFDTGVMPRLTYNADRRIGAMGGYLLGLDPQAKGLKPLGGYQRIH